MRVPAKCVQLVVALGLATGCASQLGANRVLTNKSALAIGDPELVPCTQMDSTYSCCIKKNPHEHQKCGGSAPVEPRGPELRCPPYCPPPIDPSRDESSIWKVGPPKRPKERPKEDWNGCACICGPPNGQMSDREHIGRYQEWRCRSYCHELYGYPYNQYVCLDEPT